MPELLPYASAFVRNVGNCGAQEQGENIVYPEVAAGNQTGFSSRRALRVN